MRQIVEGIVVRFPRVARAERIFAAVGAAWFLLGSAAAQGQRTLPTLHTRPAVTEERATLVRRLEATEPMHLTIMLSLRDKAGLDALVQQLYDPSSPSYRRFLSVQEFTERFGPTQRDYISVLSYAKANGMRVTGLSANRMVVEAQTQVANVEKAFNVSMGMYHDPTDNRTFYAPDREPTPNADLPLWHIAGLDNYSVPHPMSLVQDVSLRGKTSGSGPGGQFIGSDFRAAYYGGTALNGAGQSVGLLEFAGYNIADVTSYFSRVNQPLNVTVTGVSTDGSSLSCTGQCDDGEQALDIEVAISMAPGMDQVLVYVSDTSDVSIFNRMATDNLAKSLSCSWGWSPADPTSDDPIFEEFAAQGQTLFVASGDSGAYRARSRDVYPADDVYVVSVGGTDLTTNGAGGPWQSESAWSDSGGGISPNKIAIPNYQKTVGVITRADKGSLTYRNAPDVAAEANTDNYICDDGNCSGGWGGTSFAAPRWAGYIALVNQQAVANSQPLVGFLTPELYTIGLGGSYGVNFHDITSGSNGTYSTEKGFDLATGWGSPNGTGLINTLAP